MYTTTKEPKMQAFGQFLLFDLLFDLMFDEFNARFFLKKF